MPGPYAFPTAIVAGQTGEITWANEVGGALNESASAPTPNVMVLRDANGRAQVADPQAAQDIATLHYVQSLRGLGVGVNTQTGTAYTPAATDQGGLVTLSNAATITLTLPQDSALTWPVGAEFTAVAIGAGSVSFVAGTGATVTGATASAAPWVMVRCVKIAANTWDVDTPQAIPSATSSVQGTVKLAGDLGGTAAAPSVANIGGVPAALAIPAATVSRPNHCVNSTFEAAVTGWTSQYSAVPAHSAAQSHTGTYSMLVTTPGAVSGEGMYSSLASGVLPWAVGGAFSVGIWVYAPAGTPLRLVASSTGTGAVNVNNFFTATGAWQWVTANGATLGSDANPYIFIGTASVNATTFYVDDAVIDIAPAVGAPSGAVTPYTGGPTGVHVSPPYSNGSGSGGTIGGQSAGNRLVWLPIQLGACTITGFSVNVTTAGDGASAIVVGLYSDYGGVRPRALLTTLGSVASTSTGVKTLTGASYAWAGGTLWVAAVEQGHTSTCAQVTNDTALFAVATTQSINVGYAAIAQDSVSGALPASPAENAYSATRPRVWLTIQ